MTGKSNIVRPNYGIYGGKWSLEDRKLGMEWVCWGPIKGHYDETMILGKVEHRPRLDRQKAQKKNNVELKSSINHEPQSKLHCSQHVPWIVCLQDQTTNVFENFMLW